MTSSDKPRGLVPFLTAVNFLNYLDRYLMAALLPLVMAEYHLTNEQGGRLVSAFVFGYFICSPVFGALGDRYRRGPLMAIGVIIWSAATILSGLSWSFASLLAFRIMVGIGEASFGTLAPGYLKDRIPDAVKLNSVLAVFFTAIPAGSALGYVLAGEIAAAHSWQAAFFVGGIPGVVAGVALFFLPEAKRQTVESRPITADLRAIARVPALWFAIGGYVLNAFALNGIAAFVTKFGIGFGNTLEEVTRMFGMILVVTGLIGTLGGGRISSKLSARSGDPIMTMFRFIGTVSLLGTPFLAYAFLTGSFEVFLGCCLIAELFIFAATAPVNSIIVVSCPPHLVALTQGVTIFALNLFGALLAPIAIGWGADLTNLALSLQLTGVALALCGVVWLAAPRFISNASS